MVVLAMEKYWSRLRGPPRDLPTYSGCSVRRGALRPHNGLWHEDGFDAWSVHVVDDTAKDQNLLHGRGELM